MSTVLFNPTNEELKAQHQGVDVILTPYPDSGHILKVDDSRARHILNVLSPRGLTTLEYGDDRDDGAKKKAKAKSGRERNKDFKRKQLINFNELNMTNKQRKVPYLYPDKNLKAYADELGINLEQPYSAPDEGREKVSGLMEEVEKKDTLIKEQGKEVSELRGQVSTLSGQVSQLLKAFKQPDKKEALVEPIIESDELDETEMLRFRTLNGPQFKKWFSKNSDEFQNYPGDIQDEVKARYEKLFKVPFPESIPE